MAIGNKVMAYTDHGFSDEAIEMFCAVKTANIFVRTNGGGDVREVVSGDVEAAFLYCAVSRSSTRSAVCVANAKGTMIYEGVFDL